VDADRDMASTPRPRVVILSREGAAITSMLADVQPRPRCSVVATAYEAAAELLARPAAAIVIDMRAISRRHIRLLVIARQLEVEMLALGAIPLGMTSDDLSGARLVAMRDLSSAVQRLSAPPEAPVVPLEAVEPVQLTPAKKPAKSKPARRAAQADATMETSGRQRKKKRSRSSSKSKKSSPKADADDNVTPLASLLSPEELSALLDDLL